MKHFVLFLSLAAALLTSCLSGPQSDVTEEGFIPVSQDGQIYYQSVGQGEPLFLLHGHSLDMRMWDPQVDAFAQHYRVIRIDFRGYGRSSKMREDLHTTHLDDLLAVMDSLRIDKAHIVGLSMGGFVTGDMVAMHPERMLSCVMSSGALRQRHPSVNDPMTEAERQKADSTAQANIAYGIELLRQEWIDKLVDGGGSHREETREALTQIIGDWDAWQLSHVEPHLYYGHEAMDSLMSRRPAVPTLYLSGETEHKSRCGMLAYLPNGQQLELPDCGHMSNMERPDAWNDAVLSFLQSLDHH